MPYVSPIKLLSGYKLPVELKLDKETLRIARQALLAEIDLSPNQSVQLGNKAMTRNDVLQLFDAIQGDDQLRYHEAIHADQPLLDFFTESKIPVQPIHKNPIYDEPGFAAFIAPFYPEVFFNAFQQVINHPSFERMQAIFKLPATWSTDDTKRQTEVLIKGFLRKMLHKLEQIVEPNKGKTGILVRKNTVEAFYHHHLIDTLNRLPNSYTDIRTHYGVLLLELAYVLWNNKNRAESNLIARRVELLKGSYDLDYQIKHYWSQCSPSEAYESGKSEGSGVSPWTIIVGIIFLFRIVIAVGNCNSSRSRADLPIYERYPSPTIEAPSPVYNTKTQTKPVKPIEFYTAENEALKSILFKLDSVAKTRAYQRSVGAYERLYRDVKSDTTVIR